jgi:hypothetical protein
MRKNNNADKDHSHTGRSEGYRCSTTEILRLRLRMTPMFDPRSSA